MSYEIKPFHIPLERRRFLKALAAVSAGFTIPGYLAEALTISPQVTQGPYYPLAKNIPLDDDNDPIQLNSNTSIATGVVTYLSGRILTSSGTPDNFANDKIITKYTVFQVDWGPGWSPRQRRSSAR